MPLDLKEDNPIKFPDPDYMSLGNFKRGVITLTNETKIPKNALVQADNILLLEDGQPSPRPGMQWYGNPITMTVTNTNVIPNPSFEVDATSWTIGTGGTITRITTDHYIGSACLQVQSGVNNNGASISLSGLSNGTTYTIQARIKGTAGQKIYIDPTGISGTAKLEITATGGWDLISCTVTTSHTSGNIVFGQDQVSSTCFVDAVMVQLGVQVNPYFDGSTTNTSTSTYAWTGTANESTSTQTVSGVSPGAIDGFDYFDTGSAVHLVVAAGGHIFRSTNDGSSWDICTGFTLKAGYEVNMEQYNGFLYIANGQDITIRYDGTTTLQSYTVLTTPAAPTIAATGLAGTSYTVYYKISAVSLVGFSTASAGASIAIGKPRENFDTTSNYLTLTLPAPQTTQTRYDIYFSQDNLNFYYLDSVVSSAANPQTTYRDDGAAILIPSTIAPTTNTTQGPTVAEFTAVGNRLYGVRDSAFPYRIWFSSGTSPLGSFSNGYDGGYLDWQPGGKYFPYKVVDYRDGKGTNLATVWCNSADGQGCIIQMTLGTLTVGNLSVTVPSAYKLPGSRGTPSPHSVINVLNDYFFYNTQAFYNLGNRPNLLQILSTDETSANIRPTVRTITPTAENGICAIYYDAKIYISVPYNSSTNNATIVYDTELQAWLPTAYTVGFKRFLRYTNNKGLHQLLAIKPGDNQLTQLGTLYSPSQTIQGDYASAFQTDLRTGLYATLKDRFGFQYTYEMEYEFSNPQGAITIELLGIDHAKGFTSIRTATLDVSSTATDIGWDTFGWDLKNWDETSIVRPVVSEASDKRYTVVNRELNSVQWHITTAALNAGYVLRSLQTWGTDTNDAHPAKWRITSK